MWLWWSSWSGSSFCQLIRVWHLSTLLPLYLCPDFQSRSFPSDFLLKMINVCKNIMRQDVLVLEWHIMAPRGLSFNTNVCNSQFFTVWIVYLTSQQHVVINMIISLRIRVIILLLAGFGALRFALERVSISPATPVHKSVTASLLLKRWTHFFKFSV